MRAAFRLSLIALLILSLPCCSKKGEEQEGVATHYQPYTEPDNLIANMEHAWANRDLPEYRDRVLYDGKLQDPSGEAHGAFRFYFGSIGEQGIPDQFHSYDQEIRTAKSMFEGKKRDDGTPAVSSIELRLERTGDWSPLSAGEEVAGEACPEGTLRGPLKTFLRIRFEDVLPHRGMDYYDLKSEADLYLIPVRATDESGNPRDELRLWRWIDKKG